VSSASWAADDGSDNRDSGTMANIDTVINGAVNYIRYRTGGAPGFTIDLTLASAADIEGVSILVQGSPDAEGHGYSGLEVRALASLHAPCL
jgi:hypothetical protein